MRIQLHGYSYGIENVEKHNISVSRLTNEKLHLLEIRLNIDNDEVQNFKKLFNDCNNGDLVIIDQDPEIDKVRFVVVLLVIWWIIILLLLNLRNATINLSIQ